MADDNGVFDNLGASLLSLGGRFLEGTIDTLPKIHPVGGIIQAVANTDAYKTQQLEKQVRKEELLQKQYELEQKKLNRPLQEEINKKTLLQKQHELAIAELSAQYNQKIAQDRLDDYPNTRQAELARQQNAIYAADEAYLTAQFGQYSENLRRELMQNPAYTNMSISEMDNMLKSPEVVAKTEAKYFMDQLQFHVAKGDQQAIERFDRLITNRGWNIVDGDDGIKYLDMGENGTLPITRESIDLINRQIDQAALNEINARNDLANYATQGNPVKRSIAGYATRMLPYTNNSMYKAKQFIENEFNNASEAEKGYLMFNRALTDYYSSDVPSAGKIQELAACMPFLEKMGYAIDGFDGKNFNPETIRVIDLNNGGNMSFGEFAQVCREKDTLSRKMDNRIAYMAMDYAKANKQQLLDDISQMGSALSGETAGQTETTSEKPSSSIDDTEHITQMLDQTYGEDYLLADEKEQNKLSTAYDNFLRHLKNNGLLGRDNKINTDDLNVLYKLENAWNRLIKNADLDPDKYFSPGSDIILQKQIEMLEQEKAPLIKQRDAIIAENGGKEPEGLLEQANRYVGAGIGLGTSLAKPNPESETISRKFNNLGRQIDKINKEIKQKTAALEKRGVR